MSVHFRFLLYILLAWIVSPITSIFGGWGIAANFTYGLNVVGLLIASISIFVAIVAFLHGTTLYPFSEKYIGKVNDHIQLRRFVIIAIPAALALFMSIYTLAVGCWSVEQNIIGNIVIPMIFYATIHGYMWKNWGELFRTPHN